MKPEVAMSQPMLPPAQLSSRRTPGPIITAVNCPKRAGAPARHNHNYAWLGAPACAGATGVRQTGATGKSLRFNGIVSSPGMKDILLYRNMNLAHNHPCPVPTEGR